MTLPKERLLWLWATMLRIRTFEETLSQEMQAGRLRTYVHLYSGQEAVATGVCAHLGPDDYISVSYRGRGPSIAKGIDVQRMMAEVFGRATGTSRGKGGPMHVADIAKGVVTANVIVGAPIAYAVGAALTLQANKRDGAVSVAFFGDGATNQGLFHESLTMAAIWKLPVLFVCENNRYAEATPIEYAMPVLPLAKRTAAYNIPSTTVDGMDVFAVHDAAAEAVQHVRAGQGPFFLECETYRYSGHYVGDNTLSYRTREEEEEFRRRDPLVLFRERVLRDELLTNEELERVQAQVEAEIQEALRFAQESPPPGPDELMRDVYARWP